MSGFFFTFYFGMCRTSMNRLVVVCSAWCLAEDVSYGLHLFLFSFFGMLPPLLPFLPFFFSFWAFSVNLIFCFWCLNLPLLTFFSLVGLWCRLLTWNASRVTWAFLLLSVNIYVFKNNLKCIFFIKYFQIFSQLENLKTLKYSF